MRKRGGYVFVIIATMLLVGLPAYGKKANLVSTATRVTSSQNTSTYGASVSPAQ